VLDFIEQIKVVAKYYLPYRFHRYDLLLLRHYLLQSPFSISKEFLIKQGADDPYQFGETPLTELEKIARLAEVGKGDVVYDLGCGTGRTSFFLNAVFGCRVEGVEIIPYFVERAEDIKRRVGNDDVNFTCSDMLETDFYKATVVYFYGTCAEDDFVKALIERLKLNLQPGARVITISYPLKEFGESSFVLKEEVPIRFNWGASTAYLQVYQPDC